MAEEIKVSLLLPICNVERYLEEALESAVSQTLPDIEIICLDDGSTDRSPAIIDEYAARDKRIKSVHKPNTGYGHTLNLGLGMARGKYIAVLEPDDFLSAGMLSELYPLAEQHQVDFIKPDFAFLEGEPGSYHITPVHVYYRTELYGKVLPESEKRLLFDAHMAYWNSLYSRRFLLEHDIKFQETPGASYQDVSFWFRTLALAQRVYLHDGCYYHYRQDNPDASMKNRGKVFCINGEYEFIRQKLMEVNRLQDYLPEFTMCRYINYMDNLRRVATDLKHDFILSFAEDFRRMRAESLFDDSRMKEADKAMLARIMAEPEQVMREMLAIPRYIHECLEEMDDFYIYGAGARGKRIFQQLTEEDRQRCLGFLVTEAVPGQTALGEPVRCLDSVALEEGTGVIIGVTARYHREVQDLLVERHARNIIVLPEDKVP